MIQRYNECNDGLSNMEKVSCGEWVRWEDVECVFSAGYTAGFVRYHEPDYKPAWKEWCKWMERMVQK